MDIVIIGSNHRPQLITEYVKDYKLFLTPDFPLPKKDIGLNANYNNNQTGAYRCFRGHQEALKLATSDEILVFEDDAVPNKPNWLEIVKNSINLLEKYEVVSFHGRNIGKVHYEFYDNGNRFVVLEREKRKVYNNYEPNIKWSHGSLCYLVRRTEAEKIINLEWNGFPMDLILVNNFLCCIMDPSPFDHDRKHGSLVDKPK